MIAPRPVLQGVAAGLGLCLTLSAAGVILKEALRPVRPAALSVEIKRARMTATGQVFDIVVSNSGSQTAAGVEVVGQAGSETASVTLDYVPGDGEASAALAFTGRGAAAPTFAVAGWSEP